jgi:hypothetical protein
MRRLKLTACAAGLSMWLLLSGSDSAAATKTLFEMTVSPCHVCPVPVRLTLRGRYDHTAVHGTVCFLIEGAESHTSCWLAEEEDRPVIVRSFLLEHAGDYLIEMRGEKHATPAAQLMLE